MRQSRRTFLKHAGALAAGMPVLAWTGCATLPQIPKEQPPNFLFILTDDQGYGDLGVTGNPILKTPNIDRIAREGAQLDHFHVCPVCSPTRASLMTGRYHYRTGVVDTYQGRSMMDSGEITLAERLAAQGYRTGIFGKWHLGDNYPMRAMDQGFQESLVHKGGGLCQPSEPENTSYFDPLLKKNGRDFRGNGYCTDIFANAAIAFIEENAAQPFFCYLSLNAPHTPLHVEDRYWKPFAEQGLPETTARVYGMIANLDENAGRLLDTLDRLGLATNTLVIFMTDNGPAFQGDTRYNAGMRGQKGTVYEGGIRVPCFLRWPREIAPGTHVDALAAHIDILPTLLDLCCGEVPQPPDIDGQSLVPLFNGTASAWPDRTLFFQWHRGDVPEAFNNCAAITQRHKLINGKELYDLAEDPGEQNDISAKCPEKVQQLRAAYERWFHEVGRGRGYTPPRIVLGAPQENPSVLTRQDWRGAKSWQDGQTGWWEVDVAVSGAYRFTCAFPQTSQAGEAILKLNGLTCRQAVVPGTRSVTFSIAHIPAGAGRLETWINARDTVSGPHLVTIERL